MRHSVNRYSIGFIFVIIFFCSKAQNLHNETLNYKVVYKWGLVQKQAGTATLQLKESPNNYTATLYARSDNWADKFYKLRDTLTSTMSAADFLPINYQRKAHENGNFAHDIIKFERSIGNKNSTVIGHAKSLRQKKNAEITEQSVDLKAQGVVVDMLSAFYYIRNLDYNTIKPGYSEQIHIFSGKKKELLDIRYIGEEIIKIDGVKYSTYKITFTFSSEDKKKSSDDIVTWIWANKQKIPLKMEGSLKVGKIRCIYISD